MPSVSSVRSLTSLHRTTATTATRTSSSTITTTAPAFTASIIAITAAMPADLPAHISPDLAALSLTTDPASPNLTSTTTEINAASPHHTPSPSSPVSPSPSSPHSPPGNLLSPAFTPPPTPGTGTPASQRDAVPTPIDLHAAASAAAAAGAGAGSSSTLKARSKLLAVLPTVDCLVRARIPTNTGQEMFLHLYRNDLDAKEHLAIVFGPNIRSRSLDAPRPGETERDRMIRGAYTGRLFPGRMSSRAEPPAAATAPAPTSAAASKAAATASSTITKPSAASTARVSAATTNTTTTTPAPSPIPLVRIHSECYTGETVWSARCDCGEQLDEAGRLMALPSCTDGVIIYLRQEGRGIGLGEKLKAYNLQDLGNDTVEANLLLRHPADARSYGLATAMLVDLGLGGDRGIRLLTNNPDKVVAVEGPNREVVVRERVAMIPLSWKKGKDRGKGEGQGQGQGEGEAEAGKDVMGERDTYLRTKIERMGHMLQM